MPSEDSQKPSKRKRLNLRGSAATSKARNIEQNFESSKNCDLFEDTEKQLPVNKNSFKLKDQVKVCDENELNKVDSASNEVQLRKSNVKSCPVCKCDFGNLASDEELNEHINKCLDSETSDSNPSEVCQLCSKDISKYNTVRRQQHLNRCCDKLEKVTCPKTDLTSIFCPVCGKYFKTTKSRQTHVKKCAKENNVSTHQLVELNRKENILNNPTNIEVGNRLISGQNSTKADQNTLRMFRANKRKRKLPTKDLDEDIQFALALSASLQCDNADFKDIDKKGRKKKKENSELPALLLRNESEMKRITEARAAVVLCHWADDDEIQCTPALAPSSLVKKYGKESSSENDAANHEPEQIPECDLEDITDRCHSPTIEVRSGSNKKEEKCDCSKESASPSTVSPRGNESKRYFTIDTQTRLWNLASFGAHMVTTNSFYVPNLLPKSTPSKRKVTTPSKKYATRSVNSTTNDELLEQFAAVVSDKKDVHEGSPTKIASQSNGFSESQEKDIEMLVELISDENSDTLSNNDKEEQNEEIDKTWFPSSGFCVRKDTHEIQDKNKEHVDTLLNDLSCMVGNPLSSDVEIVAKDNKKFFAHSFMLIARSNTLTELLQTSYVSREDDDRNTLVRLELNDIDVRAVRAVLTYIYTACFIPVIANVIEDVKRLVNRWNLNCDSDKWEVIQDRTGQDDKDEIDHQSTECAENLDVLLNSLWEGEDEIIAIKEDENVFGDSILDDELGDMEIKIYTQVTPQKIACEKNDISAEDFVLDSHPEEVLSGNSKTLTNVERSNDNEQRDMKLNVLKNEDEATSSDNVFIPETPCSSPGKDCAEKNMIKDDLTLFRDRQVVDLDNLNSSFVSLISPTSPVELISSPEPSPLAESLNDCDIEVDASDSGADVDVDQGNTGCKDSDTTSKDVNETTRKQFCTLVDNHSKDQDIDMHEPELLETEVGINQRTTRCFGGNTTSEDVNETTRTQPCSLTSPVMLGDSSLPLNNTLSTEDEINNHKSCHEDQFIDCYDDGGFNCDIDDYFNYDSLNIAKQDNAVPDAENPETSNLTVQNTVESNVRDDETAMENNNQNLDDDVQRNVEKGENDVKTNLNDDEKMSKNRKQGKLVSARGKIRKPAKEVSKKQTKVNNDPPQDFKLREPRTPMLDYSNMATPDLKVELQHYGVKQLPKRKMVFKLKEIYNYTHREIRDSESKTDEKKEEKKSSSDKQPFSNDEMFEPCAEDENCQEGSNEDEDAESDNDSEQNWSSEDLSDDAEVLSQESSLDFSQKLMSVLTQDHELHFKILTHKISLSEVLETIKANGIKCSLNKVKDFLDEQCITYSVPRVARRQKRWRGRGKMKRQNSKFGCDN